MAHTCLASLLSKYISDGSHKKATVGEHICALFNCMFPSSALNEQAQWAVKICKAFCALSMENAHSVHHLTAKLVEATSAKRALVSYCMADHDPPRQEGFPSQLTKLKADGHHLYKI